jgi:hypothetical protein
MKPYFFVIRRLFLDLSQCASIDDVNCVAGIFAQLFFLSSSAPVSRSDLKTKKAGLDSGP